MSTTPLSYTLAYGQSWAIQEGDVIRAGQTLTVGGVPQHAAMDARITHVEKQALQLEATDAPEGPFLRPLDATADPSTVLARIEQAGIVGLGGAGFPTYKKLLNAKRNQVHTLVINGAECEAGISCDAAVAARDPAPIVEGVQAVQRLLGVEHTVFAHNERIQMPLGDETWRAVDLGTVHTPGGSERAVIQNVLGIDVPADRYPTDVGVVVFNLGTAHAIGRALQGWPLTHRWVTVFGDNQWLPIGTPVATLCNSPVLEGGTLSGRPLAATAHVNKTTNALQHVVPRAASPCIRCGNCNTLCPEALPVESLLRFNQDTDALARLRLNDCIECGLCNADCPSDINVLQNLRSARVRLREAHAREADAAIAEQRSAAHTQRRQSATLERENRRAARLRNRRRV